MDIIRFSISRPVTVAVGVILVVMFGLIGMGAIPIQLTPTVDRPIIRITTNWPGRSPDEIVDEITREQEKRLKNVTNLKRMRSVTRDGASEINLEFYIGSDIARALQEVSDSLRQVPSYPDEVDEPIIKASDGASENAIAWIIFDVDPAARERHAGFDISTIYYRLDKDVRPFLERIQGVAEVNIYGGREREVRVMLDPVMLAQRSISPTTVVEALRGENRNISAGTIAEGKRDYRVRVMGQFVTEQDVMGTVVAYRQGVPVYVRDIGTVEFDFQKQRGFVRSLGGQSLAMNVIRQSNANVVEVMSNLREELKAVESDILPTLDPVVGPDLRLRQVYDETTYIRSAVDLVTGNLWVGSLLASLILLMFLRSFTATGLIAMAIPISVVGTFLVMLAFGRTLNVISLAGLAFAVGMVVDNAIVVLENTYRRLQLGDAPFEAAYRAGREVWGAVLAATLTTVAVFIPILTIREEAGQLFRDISLAIAVSVSLSLIVSITVIPAAAARLMREPPGAHMARTLAGRFAYDLFGLATLGAKTRDGIASLVHWLITGWRAWSLRPAVIVVMVGASLTGAYLLVPPLDYLPKGNRNLVFGGLLIPPGYSAEHMTQIAERIEDQLRPYVEANEDRASLASLKPIDRMEAPGHPFDPVPIDNFFIGAFNGGMFCGATSGIEETVIPIGALLTNVMNTIPGAFGGAQQSSIFGNGIEGTGSVNIEVSGPDLDRVSAAAGFFMGLASGRFGPGKAIPDPANFNIRQPEWRVRVNDRGRELGLTTRDVGVGVRALFDGAFVDDFILDGDAVDMVILPPGGRLDFKEQLASIPISTPMGRIVPLDSVIDFYESLAPQNIVRSEELPSVSVRITPPDDMAVGQVIEVIRAEMIEPARQAGLIDSTMRIRLEGTAARLDEVQTSLFGRAERGELAGWQRALMGVSLALAGAGVVVGIVAVLKAVRRGRGSYIYGAAGAVLLGVILAGVLSGIAFQPQLVTARFVWSLVVTYLLMCSLFEDFVHPFTIMFSVPPAIVGGFVGLAVVHRVSLADPTKAPQLLDVVTMLGFVILVGTVVNNAILLVEQSLNFMNPGRYGGKDEPLPPLEAIREGVRSRVRPIMMTTCTTLGGMLPLVISPGAGSEMYRGLGAVVLGGLTLSTIFTLVLVPLVFSLTLDMRGGLRAAFQRSSATPVRAAGAGSVSRGGGEGEAVNGNGAPANGDHRPERPDRIEPARETRA